jgi:hypothetical protein
MRKLALTIFALSFIFGAANTIKLQAKPSEYDQLVRHLKTKYQAKKINIPFMFLARMVVGIARPAGVKSFSVTLFKDLKISRENLDKEIRPSLDGMFGPGWSPVFRVRSQKDQQAYMYMREEKGSVRLAVLTVQDNQAAIIRATFSPEKLIDFINDPKILGISVGDHDDDQGN